MNDMNAYCEYQPTLRDRLASLFGFKRAYVPMWDEEGFADGSLDTHVVVHLDWRDRIRVFISGRASMVVRTKTDVIVNKALSRSAFTACLPFQE